MTCPKLGREKWKPIHASVENAVCFIGYAALLDDGDRPPFAIVGRTLDEVADRWAEVTDYPLDRSSVQQVALFDSLDAEVASERKTP